MVGLKYKYGKVPVGSTHYEPESEEFVDGWMKKDENGSWSWWNKQFNCWEISECVSEWRAERMYPVDNEEVIG